MALLLTDSFASYRTDPGTLHPAPLGLFEKWDGYSTTQATGIEVVAGRYPSGINFALALHSYGSYTEATSPKLGRLTPLTPVGGVSTIIFGFATDGRWMGSGSSILIYLQAGQNSSGASTYIALNADGSITYPGIGTIGGVGTVIANKWHYYEFKLAYNPNNLTLAHAVRRDASVISASNTYSGSTFVPDRFWFRGQPNSNVNQAFTVQDLYVLDGSGSTLNDFLGDVRVELAMPNDDALNGWAVVNGPTGAFSTVNQRPADGDTSYITADVSGSQQAFYRTGLSTAQGTIVAVVPQMIVKKFSSGARTVRFIVVNIGYYGNTYTTTETIDLGGLPPDVWKHAGAVAVATSSGAAWTLGAFASGNYIGPEIVT